MHNGFFLFADSSFANEGPGKSSDQNDYDSVDHSKTYNQPEVLELLKRFRKVLDAKTAEDDDYPRIMMTEAYLPTAALAKYYGTEMSDHAGDISHMPLNFALVEELSKPEDVSPKKVINTLYLQIIMAGNCRFSTAVHHPILSVHHSMAPSENWRKEKPRKRPMEPPTAARMVLKSYRRCSRLCSTFTWKFQALQAY